jgi:hypothetical protein
MKSKTFAIRMMLLAPLLAVSGRADACSCVALQGTDVEQIEQSLNEADTVFVARLRRSSLKPDRRDRRAVAEEAQFEIIEVFKGPLRTGQIIRVYQLLSASACAQSSTNDPPWLYRAEKGGDVEPIKVSKEWLVYSRGGEPMELSRCTRSAPMSSGGSEDAKVLRHLLKKASAKH